MLDNLLLDIGGTFVKCGTLEGGQLKLFESFPMPSAGSREEILGALYAFLDAHPARRMAVSIPGPLDYDRGILMMKHKFAALYGDPLGDMLKERYPHMETVFLHDGAAFALGEMTDGGLAGVTRGAAVMLGTGLGFVLTEGTKLKMRKVLTPAYPLWNKPYREGIAENYASATAIAKRWAAAGCAPISVKEIADAARAGNETAQRVFRDTGRDLGAMLSEHLSGLGTEKIVIGGQVSKSLDLMLGGIGETCDISVSAACHPDDAALRGAYAFMENGKESFDICAE